jgi:hypothetical protein
MTYELRQPPLEDRPSRPQAISAWLAAEGGREAGSSDEDEVPIVGFLIFYYPISYVWHLAFMALGTWALTSILRWDILIPPLAFAASSLIRGGVREHKLRRTRLGRPTRVGRQRLTILVLVILAGAALGGLGGLLLSGTAAVQSTQLRTWALVLVAAVWEAVRSLRAMSS